MLTTAKLMKSLGLQVGLFSCLHPHSTDSMPNQAAGYNYVNIDDCYAEKNRTASGDIIEGMSALPRKPNPSISKFGSADKIRFKGGMKALNQQIHALGLLVALTLAYAPLH